MGSNIISLAGNYQVQGNQLQAEQFTLMICSRKSTTATKSPQFLLAKMPNGRRQYISSLYSGENIGEYHFDFSNVNYDMYVSDTTAEIRPSGIAHNTISVQL